MNENHMRGPNVLTATVEGRLKAMLAMVNMNMDTEYRFPTSNCKSLSIDVTAALEMTPESSRLREQSNPAIEHSRISTLRRNFFCSATSAGEIDASDVFRVSSLNSESSSTTFASLKIGGTSAPAWSTEFAIKGVVSEVSRDGEAVGDSDKPRISDE